MEIITIDSSEDEHSPPSSASRLITPHPFEIIADESSYDDSISSSYSIVLLHPSTFFGKNPIVGSPIGNSSVSSRDRPIPSSGCVDNASSLFESKIMIDCDEQSSVSSDDSIWKVTGLGSRMNTMQSTTHLPHESRQKKQTQQGSKCYVDTSVLSDDSILFRDAGMKHGVQ